ncbi:hypothetical protein X798_03617 [Onchocerca flexuosa]|uniref:Ovule protein n=2 Tax=Onchocerca flexuosa TaxID=387005 RepID=A0A183HJA1_9BILA|nr:hypothetical protein X798_03617 [Onchocerca flexuosa]VDO51600.1 unnamed protein product [Onchocerca flexuosa]
MWPKSEQSKRGDCLSHNSKTIEEGNTSQQAREHHFQENLGRPHIFIYNYILVQIQLADGGMIKIIKYCTDGEARDQKGITGTKMKPFMLMHIKYVMIMGKIITAASASANCIREKVT